MANEINEIYDTGATLYGIATNGNGLRWDTVNKVWTTFVIADINNYIISLTEDPLVSRRYDGDFPSDIGPGSYIITIFVQAGGSPDVNDVDLSSGEVIWDGNAVPAPTTGFCTVEELKRYLGLDLLEDTSDVLLQEMINGMVSRIQDYCGQNFTQQEYTEIRTIDNHNILMENTPITAITSITDSDDNAWVYEEDYDYYNDDLDLGIIRLLRYPNRWSNTNTRSKYTFIYTAGYDPIPEDLRLLCRQICATIFNASQNVATLDSENINGFRLVDTYRLNNDHLRLLDRFRALV